jgi:hypothetical protein
MRIRSELQRSQASQEHGVATNLTINKYKHDKDIFLDEGLHTFHFDLELEN